MPANVESDLEILDKSGVGLRDGRGGLKADAAGPVPCGFTMHRSRTWIEESRIISGQGEGTVERLG
jgi:hypothetical protein